MRFASAALGLLLAACGRIGFDEPSTEPPGGEAAGIIDTTFGDGGFALFTEAGRDGVAFQVAPRAGGGVLSLNGSTIDDGDARAEVLAYDAHGQLDASFGTAGIATLALGTEDYGYGLTILDDGRILVAGDTLGTGGHDDVFYGRMAADGSVDTTWSATGARAFDIQQDDTAFVILPSGDGYVMCGVANRDLANQHWFLARVGADGALDTAWGDDGVVIDDESTQFDTCQDAEIDSRGNIVSAGNTDSDITLTRSLPSGERDESFAGDGRWRTHDMAGAESYAVALGPEGNAYAVGENDGGALLAGLDDAGEPLFGEGSREYAWPTDHHDPSDLFYDVTVQPNGKVVAVGLHDDAEGGTIGLAVRFLPTGEVDPTFGDGGAVTFAKSGSTEFQSVTELPDGSLVVGGTVTIQGGDRFFLLQIR